QTRTVVETSPPIMSFLCNKTVECGAPVVFDTPTAFDRCEGSNLVVHVVGNDVTNRFGCTNDFSVTRTFTATNACGNSSTISQNITVLDTTPPTIACQPPRTVECGTAFTFDRPTASDICDGTNVTIIAVMPDRTNVLCGNTFRATRTWSATDRCGNVSFCNQ